MRQQNVSPLVRAVQIARQANDIFAETAIGMQDCRRANLQATDVTKVTRGARYVRPFMCIIARVSAAWAFAILPTLAIAQTGEPSIGVAALPQDLSPWGMFQHADAIVKAVMIGLAVASLVTWTVWVAKSVELLGARAGVRRGLRLLVESTTFAAAHEKLRNSKGPVAQLVRAAANEIRLSSNLRADGLKERIAWQSERIEMAAGRNISRGTGVLATIGATAPFVERLRIAVVEWPVGRRAGTGAELHGRPVRTERPRTLIVEVLDPIIGIGTMRRFISIRPCPLFSPARTWSLRRADPWTRGVSGK
jgi:hypothetical protein